MRKGLSTSGVVVVEAPSGGVVWTPEDEARLDAAIAKRNAARAALGVTACGNTPYDEGPFTIDQERTAFEAAMRVKHPEWAFTPDPVFDYHNERTRCAWEGWQAAIASGVEGKTK